MAAKRFRAVVRPSGRGGGHLVDVPPEVVRALGGKGRIPVAATFNGIPYRGSVVRMGGVPVLGVTTAIMAEAGVAPGDTLDVAVELDEGPREVAVPEDLARALARRRGLKAAFEAMAYSHRREYVRWIEEAKREDTRRRRIERALEMIAEVSSRARTP